MSPTLLDYLRHILDEADYIASQVKCIDKSQFSEDETMKRAISGMRDKVIHHYFGVDYDIVWDVAVNKVPKLRDQVESLLSEESSC